MRIIHHPAGSANAQAALSALAGWTPSRRGLLSSLLVAGAATTAVGTAAAIVIPAAAAVPTGVSPQMADLIADFTRLSAALDAAEDSADPRAWDRAAEARQPALDALVFERPSSLIDFAAKMNALAEFMAEEDSELFTLRRLAEDATALAGGGAR